MGVVGMHEVWLMLLCLMELPNYNSLMRIGWVPLMCPTFLKYTII
jgi:hypothetical protein